MSDRPLNFYQRDDGIMVFEFFVMHKSAADLFAKIVLSGSDNVPDKLRVLYDFSQSPPPTPYFLTVQGNVYKQFPHPEDEKSAYVTGVQSGDIWVSVVRSYFRSKDKMKIFDKQEDAIVWLLE